MYAWLHIGSDTPLRVDLADFVRENEFTPEEAHVIRGSLMLDGRYIGGGGAMPLWELTLVAETADHEPDYLF